MNKRFELLPVLFKEKIWQVFILLGLIFIMASCKVMNLGKYPEIKADAILFRDLEISDSSGIALVPWRELFTDTCLQSIIEKAVVNSPDIQIAIARVKKAEAAFRQNRAEFFPSLNAGVNTTFQSQIGRAHV